MSKHPLHVHDTCHMSKHPLHVHDTCRMSKHPVHVHDTCHIPSRPSEAEQPHLSHVYDTCHMSMTPVNCCWVHRRPRPRRRVWCSGHAGVAVAMPSVCVLCAVLRAVPCLEMPCHAIPRRAATCHAVCHVVVRAACRMACGGMCRGGAWCRTPRAARHVQRRASAARCCVLCAARRAAWCLRNAACRVPCSGALAWCGVAWRRGHACIPAYAVVHLCGVYMYLCSTWSSHRGDRVVTVASSDVYKHVCPHVQTHACAHVSMHMQCAGRPRMSSAMSMHMPMHMSVHISMRMLMHMPRHLCLCKCLCACLCTCLHRHPCRNASYFFL